MSSASRPFWQRPSALLWGLIDLVVVAGILAEIRWAGSARRPDAPLAVVQWGNRYREGLLAVGDLAPSFRLMDCRSGQEIEPVALRDRRPVVLVFGSYTCPVFRRLTPSLNDLHSRYMDQVDFFLVYIREAHPREDGQIPENASIGKIAAPRSSQERAKLARTLAADLEIRMPVLVDGMGDDAATSYHAWPHRVYLVDQAGKIAFTGTGGSGSGVAALAGALEALVGKQSTPLSKEGR